MVTVIEFLVHGNGDDCPAISARKAGESTYTNPSILIIGILEQIDVAAILTDTVEATVGFKTLKLNTLIEFFGINFPC
jgi:hypothetical protein